MSSKKRDTITTYIFLHSYRVMMIMKKIIMSRKQTEKTEKTTINIFPFQGQPRKSKKIDFLSNMKFAIKLFSC